MVSSSAGTLAVLDRHACKYPPYSKYLLFLGCFLENLVFQGKYLLFFVEGPHDTLKKVGIGCKGSLLNAAWSD